MDEGFELKGYENQAFMCPSCGFVVAAEESDPHEPTFLRCVACDETMDRL